MDYRLEAEKEGAECQIGSFGWVCLGENESNENQVFAASR